MKEMISRGDLYSPVVNAMRSNGGSASLTEINLKIGWEMLQDQELLSESDILALNVISVIEDLERNGLVECIKGDLYSLRE